MIVKINGGFIPQSEFKNYKRNHPKEAVPVKDAASGVAAGLNISGAVAGNEVLSLKRDATSYASAPSNGGTNCVVECYPNGVTQPVTSISNLTVTSLSGYVKGNGDSLSATMTIPTADLTDGAHFARKDQSNVFAASQTVNGTVTATAFSGSGASLTSLPAGNLTGSVGDSRLSANVPLKNATNTFTADQTITAPNFINLSASGNSLTVDGSSIELLTKAGTDSPDDNGGNGASVTITAGNGGSTAVGNDDPSIRGGNGGNIVLQPGAGGADLSDNGYGGNWGAVIIQDENGTAVMQFIAQNGTGGIYGSTTDLTCRSVYANGNMSVANSLYAGNVNSTRNNNTYTVFNYTVQDNTAPNYSLYYSQTNGQLSWKDPQGNVVQLGKAAITNAANTFTAPTATTTPIAIKAAASQTADLQQWQNSSGTVIGNVNSAGNLKLINQTATTTIRLEPYATSYGAVFFGSGTAPCVFGGINSVVVNAVTGGSASLRMNNDHGGQGGVTFVGSGRTGINQASPTASLDVQGFATTDTVLRVKGVSGQTADLQQWQNSSGTKLAGIDKDGNITGTGADLKAPTTTATVLALKGTTSYTGHLQEWQTGGGTALAYVDASGIGHFPTVTTGSASLSGGLVSGSTVEASSVLATQIGNTGDGGFTGMTVNVSDGSEQINMSLRDGSGNGINISADGVSVTGNLIADGRNLSNISPDNVTGAFAFTDVTNTFTSRQEMTITDRTAATLTLTNDDDDGDGVILSCKSQGTEVLKIPRDGSIRSVAGVVANSVNANTCVLSPNDAGYTPLILNGLSNQGAYLTDWRNGGSTVACITGKGGFRPAHMDDASAQNDTIYYSTTSNKLVYKTSGGAVNNLY